MTPKDILDEEQFYELMKAYWMTHLDTSENNFAMADVKSFIRLHYVMASKDESVSFDRSP